MANIIGDNNNNTINGDIISSGELDIFFGLGGDDILNGLGGIDYLYGGDGNDQVNGGEGNDYVDGGNGEDRLVGENGNDTLVGGAGKNALFGGEGNDSLFGGNDDDFLDAFSGRDYVNGGFGNDILASGDGGDTLIGGVGADVFAVSGPSSAVTTIADFSPADDIIGLFGFGFSGAGDFVNFLFSNALVPGFPIGAPALTPGQFMVGPAAITASQRVIYNPNTGAVFVDLDGSGSASQQQVLSLTPFLNLTHNDFFAG